MIHIDFRHTHIGYYNKLRFIFIRHFGKVVVVSRLAKIRQRVKKTDKMSFNANNNSYHEAGSPKYVPPHMRVHSEANSPM